MQTSDRDALEAERAELHERLRVQPDDVEATSALRTVNRALAATPPPGGAAARWQERERRRRPRAGRRHRVAT